jgi:hypothetical protein
MQWFLVYFQSYTTLTKFNIRAFKITHKDTPTTDLLAKLPNDILQTGRVTSLYWLFYCCINRMLDINNLRGKDLLWFLVSEGSFPWQFGNMVSSSHHGG